MLGVTFFGHVDLAQVALYMFWIFFAGLVIYLQRENMREGYPLRNDDDEIPANESLWALPSPKTFILRDGRGEVTVPSLAFEQAHMRTDLALAPSSAATGSPWVPTGNPMLDGVGPASWAPRRDVPELGAHGEPKIQPMSSLAEFHISMGRDPRGLPVVGGDGEVVGRVTDMWIDVPEQLVRYLVVDLNPEGTGQTRLVPMTMARIMSDRVRVRALYAHNWTDIPMIRGTNQITLLEEEKIMAYVAGGTLYASEARIGTVL